MHEVKEHGYMSWKSPGAVRAAGYAACMCSPCCPQLKLFQEPYVLALSSQTCAMKCLSERALLGTGGRPATGGTGSRKQGWVDGFLKYAHAKCEHSYSSLSATSPLLSLSIPSSSNFHVLFSLPDCTLDAHLPSAPCMASALYFPARLCTTWLNVFFSVCLH